VLIHEKTYKPVFLCVTIPSPDQEESSKSEGLSLEMDPFLNPLLTFKTTVLAVLELENMQIKLNVL
jgi:hypothetical protein